MTNKIDSRYPYTYACDLIRCIAGHNEHGAKLSRADASQIRSKLAEILELSDEEVANKLADYYLANEETLCEVTAEELLKIINK